MWHCPQQNPNMVRSGVSAYINGYRRSVAFSVSPLRLDLGVQVPAICHNLLGSVGETGRRAVHTNHLYLRLFCASS